MNTAHDGGTDPSGSAECYLSGHGGRFGIRRQRAICTLVLVASSACADIRENSLPDSSQTTAEGTQSSTTESEPGETGETDSASAGGAASTQDPSSDPKLDVGPPDEHTGGSTGTSCKVDFLFVIDNSGSMWDYQQNLIASFPGFVTEVASALGSNDFHVLVTDTDPYWNYCRDFAERFSPETCLQHHAEGCLFDGVQACTSAPSECDDQPGAGVRFPTGYPREFSDSPNLDCGLPSGRRYISAADTQGLSEEFECIASVGWHGELQEEHLGELRGAVELSHPGECNEGFIRDDAILVVTLLTDEEDQASAVSWQETRDTLVNAKGGTEGVVMLGILPDTDACEHSDEDNPAFFPVNLTSLVSAFPFHRIAPVCTPNYATELTKLLEEIELSCDAYEPVG